MHHVYQKPLRTIRLIWIIISLPIIIPQSIIVAIQMFLIKRPNVNFFFEEGLYLAIAETPHGVPEDWNYMAWCTRKPMMACSPLLEDFYQKTWLEFGTSKLESIEKVKVKVSKANLCT